MLFRAAQRHLVSAANVIRNLTLLMNSSRLESCFGTNQNYFEFSLRGKNAEKKLENVTLYPTKTVGNHGCTAVIVAILFSSLPV